MAKSLYTRHNEVLLTLLRDRRQAIGLPQTGLAQKLGQTQATVSRVETGERRLDVIELRAWLTALDTDFVLFMNTLDAHLRELRAHEGRLGLRQPIGRSHG
jgi:transcriptional regulator with XRE-family HTH domain